MEKQAAREQARPESAYRSRVVVKFQDFVELPYEDGAEGHIQKLEIGPWDRLAAEYPGITLNRLYTTLAPAEVRALVDRAVELDRTYHAPNLLTYFVIDCPPAVDPEALAKSLSAWRTVQTAYVESGPVPPPQPINPSDDPRFPNQGYLSPAPNGIDAPYAWTFPGGGGDGIQFVDMEQGWMLNHEDLPSPSITLLSGINKTNFDHGTAVLGVINSVDNQIGDIGIAPHSSGRVVSEFQTTGGTLNRPDAIMSAIKALNFGDVLLLEAQTAKPESPAEVELAVFDTIRLATALGVVVVEPAGNGQLYLDSAYSVLNRTSPKFKDSGAIMVGAATSTYPHLRKDFSNYGSRVDCYAWGENVDTCWTDSTGSNSLYTTGFLGTSSASAIVAGAAMVVQGIADAKLKRRFSAWQLRAILSDVNLGTPAENPPGMVGDPCIGVMPDLKAIITNKLNVAPDVYVRDFVGDKGDPHTGAINASPDVILLEAEVADPQASFGEGSGTEDSNTLGDEAKVNQDNYVYVRVRNRGGSAAKGVVATVYWSPVATLVTPSLWTPVGSVTIPDVPAGDQLTVSAPITWPAQAIPGPGHYCFVCLVGNELDPAPTPPDYLDWNSFYRLIRDNNNVTWRNFQVVGNAPQPPSEYVELPFLATGWPETALRFQLAAVARLPEGAVAWLEMPHYLADAMGERSPYLRVDRGRGTTAVPLNPHGRTALGEALFPAGTKAPLRLLVQIPREFRENAYEIFVSQLYEGGEVGRITWRLAPTVRRTHRIP